VQTRVLGLEPITIADVVADAASAGKVLLAPSVEADLLADAAATAANNVAYGRTTGVGANRDESADDSDGMHGRRLVRSHVTGAGPVLPPEVGRAAALVRASQLSFPGSGIPFDMLDALVRSLNDGRTAPVRTFGGLGTGDITSLAELALCLLGELPWQDGEHHRYLDHVQASGALAFVSASAPTIAIAALAVHRLDVLARASLPIAALSSLAIRANREQWSEVAAETRPSPGSTSVAAAMRHFAAGSRYDHARTQDPLSFRCIPFVAGPLRESIDEVTAEVDRMIAARAENPRYADGVVHHHGSFMLTGLALRLDTVRLAATQWLSTSLARLVKLHDPDDTGQARFLAAGPSGSSGTMVLEYTAASALRTVSHLADPASRHTTSISVGVEDHASFATRGALALRESLDAFAAVLGCELVAAVRAVRGALDVTPGAAITEVLGVCDPLPSDVVDRPLASDVATAVDLLPALASLVR
jgi:histidine ammonia-lyase